MSDHGHECMCDTCDPLEPEPNPLEQYRDLLRGFVAHEDRPCSLDHHGNCQEHGWFIDQPGEECGAARARRLLGLDSAEQRVRGMA